MENSPFEVKSIRIYPVGPFGMSLVGQAEVVDNGRTVFVIVYADSGELGYAVETRSAFDHRKDECEYEFVLEEYDNYEETIYSKYAELFWIMHDKIVELLS